MVDVPWKFGLEKGGDMFLPVFFFVFVSLSMSWRRHGARHYPLTNCINATNSGNLHKCTTKRQFSPQDATNRRYRHNLHPFQKCSNGALPFWQLNFPVAMRENMCKILTNRDPGINVSGRGGGEADVERCIVIVRKEDYEQQLWHLFKADDKNWQVPGQSFQKWSPLKITKLGMHLGIEVFWASGVMIRAHCGQRAVLCLWGPFHICTRLLLKKS